MYEKNHKKIECLKIGFNCVLFGQNIDVTHDFGITVYVKKINIGR